MTSLLLAGYAIAIGITASLAAHCLIQRDSDVSRVFGTCMLALVMWSLGAFGRLIAPTEAIWYIWTILMYLGVVSAAVLLFVFVLLYTGFDSYLSRGRVVALFVVPCLSILLVATNPAHGLFFESVITADFGGSTVFTAQSGPWFWANALYSYLLFGAATTLLAGFAISNHRIYRRQALAVVVGATIPWFVNVSYVFFLGLTFPVDPTPIGFAAGSVLIAHAVFGLGLADLTPVARSAVVDAIDDAVFVVDTKGRLVDHNSAAEELLADADDTIGEAISQLLPPGLLDQPEEPISVTVDGKTRWYQSRRLPLDDRGGGSVLLVSDLTDEMRRQRQLREQNRRLEEFTRVAAHDLRNPLNTVSGYAELARETGDISYLEKIDPATDRIETLINDLLTLGREGRVVEDVTPVCLSEIANRAWKRVDTGEATLEADTDRYVLADEARFRQLLENLFTNAVSHGGEDVTVRIDTLPDGFFVADDGTGIPTENRADVFEYGYSTHGGTGLGLPVVRSIAVAHGWEVSVTEAAEGGARFEFEAVRIHSGPPSTAQEGSEWASAGPPT